ncbi:MAG TPA: acetolactate synthase small subunit [Syntrophorhabdaceae bacterium]|nr:acetolactate synthase small subunit [Syntrophorhabdaceae bacterium]HNQ63825.1 acetolactate synthase small subunit [Syntrophorhabdaceae bacterium]HOB69632.1 acetolactate synthase small subunit [Syntrophorhabdaceae bacterium]
MRHIISVLVENEFGVLSRIAGLFSGRGFNIESLCVAEGIDPTISTMTIVTTGNEAILEQILKQLNKLINVIKVTDFKEMDYVSREMILVKLHTDEKTRAEILRMAEIFRGKIIDVSPKTYTLLVTGDEEKLKAFLALVKPIGIKELVRTGAVAIARGEKTIKPKEIQNKGGEADG